MGWRGRDSLRLTGLPSLYPRGGLDLNDSVIPSIPNALILYLFIHQTPILLSELIAQKKLMEFFTYSEIFPLPLFRKIKN